MLRNHSIIGSVVSDSSLLRTSEAVKAIQGVMPLSCSKCLDWPSSESSATLFALCMV